MSQKQLPESEAKKIRRRWILFITISVLAWMLGVSFALYWRFTHLNV